MPMKRLVTVVMLLTLCGVASVCIAQENTWTKKADMPTARSTIEASVFNGKIYELSHFHILSGSGMEDLRFSNASNSAPRRGDDLRVAKSQWLNSLS